MARDPHMNPSACHSPERAGRLGPPSRGSGECSPRSQGRKETLRDQGRAQEGCAWQLCRELCSLEWQSRSHPHGPSSALTASPARALLHPHLLSWAPNHQSEQFRGEVSLPKTSLPGAGLKRTAEAHLHHPRDRHSPVQSQLSKSPLAQGLLWQLPGTSMHPAPRSPSPLISGLPCPGQHSTSTAHAAFFPPTDPTASTEGANQRCL